VIAATQAVSAAATFLLWWAAARYWEPQEFAQFLVLRRGLNLVQIPLVTVFQLALIRYGAAAYARPGSPLGPAYLVAGTWIAAVLAAATAMLMVGFAGPLADWLLGDASLENQIVAGAWAVCAFAGYSVVYSCYCGRFAVTASCLLQIAFTGVVPLGILLVPGNSVAEFLVLQAAAGELWRSCCW
jgi:hypothetical protein